jgi:hypothetical protein
MQFAPPPGVPPARTVLVFAWTRFDPIEADFWRRLDRSLAARDLRLMLAAPASPPAGFPVATMTVPRWLDELSPLDCDGLGSIDVATLGFDESALLARETHWSGPALMAAVEDGRRLAMASFAAFWASTLSGLRPAVTVIWNGEHVPELLLKALCRLGDCPTLVVERGPIPRTLFVDEEGLLTSSRIARSGAWPPAAEPWRTIADRVAARLACGNLTAWEQPPARETPSLRATIGARADQTVLLFAGQVDADTQRFLFSPHFPDNVSAFRAFLRALRGRDDVFVLGKQHPYSQTPARVYAEALAESRVPGAWRSDLAIDDALSVADRVAAVNSTVLYEGLARGRPALVLGQWLLSGRGAAEEIDSADALPAAVARWLAGAGAARQQHAWRAGLAHLLSTCLYAIETPEVAGDRPGADDLADRLARRAAGQSWQPPDALLPVLLPRGSVLGSDWWHDEPWTAAADERRRLQAATEVWRIAMRLRPVILRARAAAAGGRPLVIWGTGEAARLTTSLLADHGLAPDAYADSHGGATRHVAGRPVLGPTTLRGRGAQPPYVVIASVRHAEITPALLALGFAESEDFAVVDGAALAGFDPCPAPAGA